MTAIDRIASSLCHENRITWVNVLSKLVSFRSKAIKNQKNKFDQIRNLSRVTHGRLLSRTNTNTHTHTHSQACAFVIILFACLLFIRETVLCVWNVNAWAVIKCLIFIVFTFALKWIRSHVLGNHTPFLVTWSAIFQPCYRRRAASVSWFISSFLFGFMISLENINIDAHGFSQLTPHRRSSHLC